MPFTVPEVIEMSNILRNTILGLIVFIYPDVRIPQTLCDEQWYLLCQVSTIFTNVLLECITYYYNVLLLQKRKLCWIEL